MTSCGNPASEQDALMQRRTKFDKTRLCWKCREKVGNVVIRHAVYCRECFFPIITTKFKRALEPFINPGNETRRQGLKPAGNLCVAFSAGLGSTVLLDLISRLYFSAETGGWTGRGGTDHPRNAPVWKKTTICYVETSSALPGTRDRTEDVRAVVAQYAGFASFVPLRLEDAFDDAWWGKVGGRPPPSHVSVDLADEELLLAQKLSASDTPVVALRAYLAAMPTQTAIPSAIQNLIRLLLLHTAWATESSHLLLGTSLTSLSVSLISSISQGGGFVVREEAQEEWQPTVYSGSKRNVRVTRPMRDIGMKECAIWAWWHKLTVVGKENYLGGKQGIGTLTKSFIVGLERDYPSTVSTIVRTCAKLAPKNVADGRCVLCGRPAQPDVQAWKARISIRAFDEQGDVPPHRTLAPDPAPDERTRETHEDAAMPPRVGLTPHLCYACHTTLTSRSSRGSAAASTQVGATPLPVWVESGLEMLDGGGSGQEKWNKRKMGESEMKEAIAEFLLPKEDA
ncbi:hypothetical protein GGX14DRAFT_510835 [Mycena pura]|uniref:Cytoplasmic tRNA 2-thiolation protein 2 n=1 Tax=Mycena pura TaxID=153505 RepID=A0AAD7E3X0_9AGAR|nr:hypothetical protein GGX14DRAFT_510835 [Mycena pura]